MFIASRSYFLFQIANNFADRSFDFNRFLTFGEMKIENTFSHVRSEKANDKMLIVISFKEKFVVAHRISILSSTFIFRRTSS